RAESRASAASPSRLMRHASQNRPASAGSSNAVIQLAKVNPVLSVMPALRSERALGIRAPGGAGGDRAGLLVAAHDEGPAAALVREELEREAAIFLGAEAQRLAEALA